MGKTMVEFSDYFESEDPLTLRLFDSCQYVWQALEFLEENVDQILNNRRVIVGEIMPGAHLSERPIYVAAGARIEPGAYIIGPAYIGPGVVIRHGALVRENVVMLSGSLLGHASEAKNSIFLPKAAAPHFNYVGDSILGQRVNLGAGTKLSNLTLISKKDAVSGKRPTIKLTINGTAYDTGLAKLGAILGDDVQTGCNAVLNPGCLVGSETLIYPNMNLAKGYYPSKSIVKLRQTTKISANLFSK